MKHLYTYHLGFEPRPMAVHRVLHHSCFYDSIDGVQVKDGLTIVKFTRKLKDEERDRIDQMLREADLESNRGTRRRRRIVPPAEEEAVTRSEVASIVGGELARLEGKLLDSLGRMQRSVGSVAEAVTNISLVTATRQPSFDGVLNESIADVDTAGESNIEAAPQAEELVRTEDVVDTEIAGELARLKELKATKDEEDE